MSHTRQNREVKWQSVTHSRVYPWILIYTQCLSASYFLVMKTSIARLWAQFSPLSLSQSCCGSVYRKFSSLRLSKNTSCRKSSLKTFTLSVILLDIRMALWLQQPWQVSMATKKALRTKKLAQSNSFWNRGTWTATTGLNGLNSKAVPVNLMISNKKMIKMIKRFSLAFMKQTLSRRPIYQYMVKSWSVSWMIFLYLEIMNQAPHLN